MLGRTQYPDGTTVPAAQWHGGGLRLNGGSSKVEEPWVGQSGRQGGREASVSGHLGEARAATSTAASHTRAPALRPSALIETHHISSSQYDSHPFEASSCRQELGETNFAGLRPGYDFYS